MLLLGGPESGATAKHMQSTHLSNLVYQCPLENSVHGGGAAASLSGEPES